MRMFLFVPAAIALFLLSSPEALARCGSRDGPGYRGPDGKCVGRAALNRVCGKPWTTRCTKESSDQTASKKTKSN